MNQNHRRPHRPRRRDYDRDNGIPGSYGLKHRLLAGLVLIAVTGAVWLIYQGIKWLFG